MEELFFHSPGQNEFFSMPLKRMVAAVLPMSKAGWVMVDKDGIQNRSGLKC